MKYQELHFILEMILHYERTYCILQYIYQFNSQLLVTTVTIITYPSIITKIMQPTLFPTHSLIGWILNRFH